MLNKQNWNNLNSLFHKFGVSPLTVRTTIY